MLRSLLMLSLLAAKQTHVLGTREDPSYSSSDNNDIQIGKSMEALSAENSSLPIVKYCCEVNHYFDLLNNTCAVSPVPLDPPFYTKDKQLVEKPPNVQILSKLNDCSSYLLNSSLFYLLTNGSILLHGRSNIIMEEENINLMDYTKYCLMWIHDPQRNVRNGFTLSALICFQEESNEVSTFHTVVKYYLLPISMGISAFFLAATFVVYCLVGELQDLLGKSLMCSVASLCLSKVFGVIARSASHLMSLRACVFIALMMYLEFLHAFFWVNVISFVIFFSVCFQGRLKNQSRRKWFIIGCLYAFGVPILIMALILIHDMTSHFDNYPVPKPGFGVASCGFTNRGAQVVYFYAPISILLGINLILFCASACRLFILSKQTTTSVFQFTHYLKLLVLMGIPWIFEVLSFFFDDDEKVSPVSFLWLIFDVFNALQGVVIFIVFACRRAVFARVAETVCGSSYARTKYPDVFLQHANDETRGAATQDLRLMDTVVEADNNGG